MQVFDPEAFLAANDFDGFIARFQPPSVSPRRGTPFRASSPARSLSPARSRSPRRSSSSHSRRGRSHDPGSRTGGSKRSGGSDRNPSASSSTPAASPPVSSQPRYYTPPDAPGLQPPTSVHSISSAPPTFMLEAPDLSLAMPGSGKPVSLPQMTHTAIDGGGDAVFDRYMHPMLSMNGRNIYMYPDTVSGEAATQALTAAPPQFELSDGTGVDSPSVAAGDAMGDSPAAGAAAPPRTERTPVAADSATGDTSGCSSTGGSGAAVSLESAGGGSGSRVGRDGSISVQRTVSHVHSDGSVQDVDLTLPLGGIPAKNSGAPARGGSGNSANVAGRHSASASASLTGRIAAAVSSEIVPHEGSNSVTLRLNVAGRVSSPAAGAPAPHPSQATHVFQPHSRADSAALLDTNGYPCSPADSIALELAMPEHTTVSPQSSGTLLLAAGSSAPNTPTASASASPARTPTADPSLCAAPNIASAGAAARPQKTGRVTSFSGMRSCQRSSSGVSAAAVPYVPPNPLAPLATKADGPRESAAGASAEGDGSYGSSQYGTPVYSPLKHALASEGSVSSAAEAGGVYTPTDSPTRTPSAKRHDGCDLAPEDAAGARGLGSFEAFADESAGFDAGQAPSEGFTAVTLDSATDALGDAVVEAAVFAATSASGAIARAPAAGRARAEGADTTNLTTGGSLMELYESSAASSSSGSPITSTCSGSNSITSYSSSEASGEVNSASEHKYQNSLYSKSDFHDPVATPIGGASADNAFAPTPLSGSGGSAGSALARQLSARQRSFKSDTAAALSPGAGLSSSSSSPTSSSDSPRAPPARRGSGGMRDASPEAGDQIRRALSASDRFEDASGGEDGQESAVFFDVPDPLPSGPPAWHTELGPLDEDAVCDGAVMRSYPDGGYQGSDGYHASGELSTVDETTSMDLPGQLSPIPEASNEITIGESMHPFGTVADQSGSLPTGAYMPPAPGSTDAALPRDAGPLPPSGAPVAPGDTASRVLDDMSNKYPSVAPSSSEWRFGWPEPEVALPEDQIDVVMQTLFHSFDQQVWLFCATAVASRVAEAQYLTIGCAETISHLALMRRWMICDACRRRLACQGSRSGAAARACVVARIIG